MTYTILVVIVLILASGFIAYWGDILGRRMGKKRLTLFNLRPRYTAIVVTTITGMIISALVLGAALSFNAEFRKGVTQYEQILKSRRQLAKENGELALRGKQLRAEVAKQRNEVAGARQDASLAKAQRDKAQAVVARLRKEIAQRQKELVELSKRANAAQDELEQRRSDIKLVQQDLRVAQDSLARANEAVKETQAQLEVAQTRLTTTQAQLQATQADLNGTLAALNAYDEDSRKALNYLVRLRTSDIPFRQGDEIVRGKIDPTRSRYEITRDLERLLDLASKKVIENGAKVGDNGRAVNVVYRDIEGNENVLFMFNEDKYISLAVDKIMSSDSEVLVQIVCGMSSLPDAQVPVAIRLYLNRPVYSTGDRIAQARIDGSQSQGAVLLAVNDFLQADVAKAAAEAGVVPVTGQDPRDALGANREAQADELLRLVSEIKSVNGTARISANATDDIHAADTLSMSNVRFAVTKAR